MDYGKGAKLALIKMMRRYANRPYVGLGIRVKSVARLQKNRGLTGRMPAPPAPFPITSHAAAHPLGRSRPSVAFSGRGFMLYEQCHTKKHGMSNKRTQSVYRRLKPAVCWWLVWSAVVAKKFWEFGQSAPRTQPGLQRRPVHAPPWCGTVARASLYENECSHSIAALRREADMSRVSPQWANNTWRSAWQLTLLSAHFPSRA